MNTEKVGFHPFIIGHEGPYGEQRYSSTLDRTSAPDGDGGGGSAPRPGRRYPRETPGTYCTGGMVGPRAGIDGRKISPTGLNPGLSSP